MLKWEILYIFAFKPFVLFRPYAGKTTSFASAWCRVDCSVNFPSVRGCWRLCEAGWSSRWLQIPSCKCPVIYCRCRDSALLVPFIRLSFDCEKKAREKSSAGNKYNMKWHKLQYVSITTVTGVVNENGCQTGARPGTLYSFTFFLLPFFSPHPFQFFLPPFPISFISLSYNWASWRVPSSITEELNEEKSIPFDWFSIIRGGLTPHCVPKK